MLPYYIIYFKVCQDVYVNVERLGYEKTWGNKSWL